MRGVWIVLALAGCGRIGFDLTSAAVGDAARDTSAPNDGPLPCPPTAILCESFETAPVGWASEISGGGVNVSRTTAFAHSGIGALEAQVVPSASSGRAALHRVLDGSAAALATRLWVYPIEPLQSFDHVLTWFGTPLSRFFALGGDEVANWVFTLGVPPSDFVDHHSTTAVPVGTWSCVEIVRRLGTMSSGPTVQLYVNDALVLDDPIVENAVYLELYVGLVRGAPVGGHVVIDDLVVSDRTIGCQ
jgi:hypothetical protein